METVSCLVCRSHAWVPAVESQDFLHHLPGTFTVARCQACGFMATNPRPDAEEIRAYYPEEYGPYQLNQERVAKHVGFRKRFPFLYQLVEPHIFVVAKEGEADRELNILEIGCGAGNFLYELKLRFPRWHLSGTDFSQASIERLQQEGIAAYVSDLRTLREADRSQDVVYGFMIIEHLHFLEETLAEVQRVLKDDGHFVVAVPNIASWQFRLFGRFAYILHLPAHLYHFTEATLTTIMERNGFVCERVVYHRTLQDSSFSLCNAIRESVLPAAFKRALLSIVRWRTLYHFLTLPLAYLQAWTKESPGMTFVFRKSA
jgi:ubiquinone/menaquinone biosynthesis C-methylase UbiE